MTTAVSVVIPTVGRSTLTRAVRSALDQSLAVVEVIVVADTEGSIALPSDDRIRLLRNEFTSGPARSRQTGIDAARGTVIALLDDDDEWSRTKLESQLAAVRFEPDSDWIVSSRMSVRGPGSRLRIWPHRLIEPRQPVADYLFRVRRLGVGGAVIQTSTLCFPTDLARRVRWDSHAGAIHDEASWLMAVQRSVPGLRVIQLPDVLSTYHVGGTSVSKSDRDLAGEYIKWGLNYLSAESPRILGDYLCSSPVSAAVSAGSLAGVRRATMSAVTYGRPGAYAMAYAMLSYVRIVLRKLFSVVRR